MEKSKLNKEDKKALIISLVIGFIAQFFIESAMSIAILCFCMYLFHKYISTTENIREYDSYEFSDKYSYNKGKKLFVGIVDVYIVIRIILILLKPESSYAFAEILLILIIYSSYEKYLNKKYVIRTNILEEEEKVVFARRKILLTIGMIVFIGFSIFTIDAFKKISTENHVKYGKYEYNISGIEGSREIEVSKLVSDYMNAEESHVNSKYFDNFIESVKALMKKQIIKSYSFISMIIALVLCFIETYPKKEKVKSTVVSILCISALIFSVLSFNIDVSKDKIDLSSYFHEYMGRGNL